MFWAAVCGSCCAGGIMSGFLAGFIVAGCGLLVVLLVFLGLFPLGFVLCLLLDGCLLELLALVSWDLFLLL
jgi:hypothetical protein